MLNFDASLDAPTLTPHVTEQSAVYTFNALSYSHMMRQWQVGENPASLPGNVRKHPAMAELAARLARHAPSESRQVQWDNVWYDPIPPGRA